MEKYIVLFFAFYVTYVSAQNPLVLRGPYLQNPTPSSIVIKWRTDTKSTSTVFYGTSQNTLTSRVDSTSLTTEHTVKISNLLAGTQYYYSIGTSTTVLSGPSIDHRFKTSPISGEIVPVRVWAIGDFGKGIQKQADVRDSYLDYVGSNNTDVWLWLGDNAYDTGTDDEYQKKVFEDVYGYNRMFPYMPFMPCPGNHDYGSISPPPGLTDPMKHSGAYYDIIDVPKNGEAGGIPSGTELYYSYDYANIHFVSLNSELGSITPAYDYIGAFSSDYENLPMVKWLRQDLAANTLDWTIVYWHQCPYSKGSHDSDSAIEFYIKAMRDNITPVIEEYGVDLVICGHSHVYERSYLINGHTGTSDGFDSTNIVSNKSGNFDIGEAYYKYKKTQSPTMGTVYVVCGNSASDEGSATLNHPIMAAQEGCTDCIGSFVVEIEGNRLNGKYLKYNGIIGDYFSILKEDYPLGVEKISLPITNINVIPNPFKTHARVDYKLNETKNLTINLTDVNGKHIQTFFSGKQTQGEYSVEISGELLGISSGTYFLLFQDDDKLYHKQVIKIE